MCLPGMFITAIICLIILTILGSADIVPYFVGVENEVKYLKFNPVNN